LLNFPKSNPIVGMPAVHDWRCIVSFSCSCGKGKPMLITAADQAAACDGCGDTYVLAALQYSRNVAGKAGVALQRIPRSAAAPTGTV
jgi:hypothetical protein